MIRFQLNKVVRDEFINIYKQAGQVPQYRILEVTELREHLISKIIEESQELTKTALTEVIDELADIQQALEDLRQTYGISTAKFKQTLNAKKAKKGGFGKGVYIEVLALQDDDPWVSYYRNEPTRFPEIV